jgi:hypothetical protein
MMEPCSCVRVNLCRAGSHTSRGHRWSEPSTSMCGIITLCVSLPPSSSGAGCSGMRATSCRNSRG